MALCCPEEGVARRRAEGPDRARPPRPATIAAARAPTPTHPLAALLVDPLHRAEMLTKAKGLSSTESAESAPSQRRAGTNITALTQWQLCYGGPTGCSGVASTQHAT